MNRRARQLTSSQRRWALRPLPAALMATMMPMAAWSFDVGQVVHGQVTSSTNGTATNVKVLTDTAVINTKDSSIRANESVSIDMLSGRSSLLVRDTSYDPTYLLGSLQSNGRVFFLNPNGIVIGNGFRADVGALVASTLNLSDDDFKKKQYKFSSVSGGKFSSVPGGAGAIVQSEGSLIQARETVAFVAPQVTQQGTIVAPRVGLAAGTEALLDLDGDGLIFLQVGNAREAATRLSQLGTIVADGGTVDIQARAREALADTVLNVDGIIRARSLGTREGRVVIDGGSAGVTAVNGQIDVTGDDAGERGGQISVLGDKVGLFGTASLDASGQAGGGTVLVGGNYQGSGDERRASRTFIGKDTSIKANATESGDGGKVVVWSDQVTRYFGHIEAQGGQQGGNGGFVEVSGKQSLVFDGKVSLLAPLGTGGTLLLDPQDIILASSGGAAFVDQASPTPDVAFAASSGSDITLDVDDLEGVAELRLQASRDILFNTNLVMDNNNSVVLLAGRNISLGTSTLRVQGTGTITLTANAADGSGSEVDDLGSITTGTGGLIRAGSGQVTLSAGSTGIDVDLQASNVSVSTTALGNVTIRNSGNLAFAGTASTVAGNLALTVASGSINSSGALSVTGTSSFTTTGLGETITLSNVTLGGAASFSTNSLANLANVSVTSASGVILGTSSVEGSLSVTSGGHITQTGALTVGGATTLSLTSAASDILLASQANALAGAVTISGTLANVRDLAIRNTSNSASLPGGLGSSMTGLRDLTLLYSGNVGVIDLPALSLRNLTVLSGRTTATGDNAITDAGIVTATGDVSFTATGADRDIVVNQLDVTGTISVNTTGSAAGATVVNAQDVELATSSVGGNLSITSNSHITQASAATLTVGGTTTLQVATNDSDILLGNTGNSLAGAITFAGSATRIRDVSITNANAAAAVPTLTALTNLRNLTINFSAANVALGALNIDGNLSVTSGGATGITDTGILTVGGTASFTTTASNATIVVNQLAVDGTIAVNTTGAAGHATIVNDVGVDLAASTVGGNLSATATTGNITDSAAITVTGGASYVTLADNATITVDNQAVTGAFAVTTNGTTGHATITNATGVTLATSTVDGNLTVTATNGNITDTGTVTVSGNASYTASTADTGITLDTQAVAGQFTLNTSGTSGDASITNATAVVLAASSVGGDLGVTATTGGITDSGTVSVAGNASFTTTAENATIVVNQLAVDGTIAATTDGTAGHATIVNDAGVNLGASNVGGNLTATAITGDITDSGTVTVGGNAIYTTSATDAVINVDTQAVTGTFALTTTGTAGHATITNATGVALAASTIRGNLGVTASNGDITDTGTITVSGTARYTASTADTDITLNTQAVTGQLTLNTNGTTGHATVTNATAVALAASSVGGDLGVTATTGGITDAGTIVVGGNARYTTTASGASITVDQQDVAGTFAISTHGAGADATIVNAASKDVELATSTVGGALSITSGTHITQATGATLGVGGTTTLQVLTAGSDILLGSGGNNLAGAIIFAGTQSFVRDLALGSNSASASIPSLANLSSLRNLTINFSAADITLSALNISGNLAVTSGGANGITDTGPLTDRLQVAGTATFTTTAANADISLDQLSVTGSISANTSGSGGHATLVNATGVDLGASSVGGNLTATATTGNITDSGTVSVGGNASYTTLASGADIAVNQQAVTGRFVVNTTGSTANATILNATGVVLGASTVHGDLTVTATAGNITDNGLITVDGNARYTASGAGATINVDQQAVAGTFAVNTNGAGADATIVNTGAVTLLASSVGGDLAVTAQGGNIADNGTIVVGGNASYTSTTSGATITVNEQDVSGTFAVNTTGAGADATIINVKAVTLATSDVGGTLRVTSSSDITQASGATLVTGGDVILTVLTAGSDIELGNGGNAFGGAFVVDGDQSLVRDLALGGSTLTSLPSLLGLVNLRDLTLNFSTADIVLPTLNITGNLSVTSGGTTGITATQAIVVAGNASFTTTQANADIIASDLTVGGSLSANTTGTGGNATLVNATAVNLAASDVGGNLSVTATTGNITDSGTVTVDGTASYTTAQTDATITLNQQDVGGAVTLSTTGGNADVQVVNARALQLNTSSIGGNLDVTALTGDLSDGGTITVGGTARYTTSASNASITLDEQNVAGTVSLNTVGTAGDASIANAHANGLNLATSSVGGNLSAIAASGNLTDVGTITVGGRAAYTTNTSNATIVVNQQAVSNGIAVNTTGASGHATINNTLGVTLGSSNVGGNLSVTAGGAITQNGAIDVNGSTTLSATGQAITLTNASNDFTGNVSATGAAVQITDINALNTSLNASGAATLVAGGNLGVSGSAAGLSTTTTGSGTTTYGATTVAGNLSTTSAGAVSQSGSLNVTGTSTVSASGQTITLTNASNNFTGNVSATGSAVQITDTNALNAAITASGAATLIAGGNLAVSGSAAGLTTTTTNAGTTTFGATAVAGNLSTTSAAAVSQTGALSVTGTSTVSASGQTITLTNAGNNFTGNVSATGSTVQITDTNALTAVVNASGAATLVAGGNLDVSGSAAGLSTTTTGGGTTTYGATTVAGNLSATSAGAVSQSGSLNVSGTSTVSASGQTITLTNASNDFTGNVSATGSTVQITDSNALNAVVTASGAATLIAGGNLGAAGSAAGLTTTTTNAGTTAFGATNVTGNLATTSAGAVTQSDALTVSGTTTVVATGQAITLNNTGNDFTGTVTATGSTVRITDANALTAALNASGAATLIAGGNLGVSGSVAGLTTTTTNAGTTTFGATTVTGNLSSTSAGNIQDTGTLTVSGTSSLTAAGTNATITLDQLASTGAVDVHTVGSNGHVTIANASALTLDAGDVQGNLSASAQGSLVLTDAVQVDGGNFIHLRATGAGSDVTASQALSSGSGEINVRADRHVTLNGNVNSTGRVLAQAGGNIVQGAGRTISGDQIGLVAGGSATGLNLTAATTALVKAGGNITGQINANTAGLQSTSGLINADTSVNTLSAQAGSSITIDNDKALTVGATAGGSVSITAAGALTVAPIGVVTLAASGAGVPTGKAFEAAESATAQSGVQTGSGATLNLASGSSNDDITLNGVVTANGGGAITASGKVRINNDLNLTQGTLNITANANPSATLRPGVFSSQNAQIRVFEGVVTQGGGRIVTGTSSTLVVNATNNGSIYLTGDNDIRGGISAVSGTSGEVGDARFLGTAPISVSEISIKSTEVNVAGKPDGAVPGPVGSAKGLEGDSIVLETSKISTNQFDGTIRGRMPFDKTLQIVAASMPSLSLKIPASALGGGGNPLFVGGSSTASWIQTRLGSDALGGLVTVVPAGVGQDKAIVFLGGIDPVPVYPGSGKPTEIRVFYNGLATATPEEEAALSSVLSIIEDQRRVRFEETVRTENVSSRLRAGVIAEVGAGRPATEGSESILMPPSCTPAAGAMTCQ